MAGDESQGTKPNDERVPPPATVRTEPRSVPPPSGAPDSRPRDTHDLGPAPRPANTPRMEPDSSSPPDTRPPAHLEPSAEVHVYDREPPAETVDELSPPSLPAAPEPISMSGELEVHAAQTARASAGKIELFDDEDSAPSLDGLGDASWGSADGSQNSLADFGSNLEGVSRQASSAARRALQRDEAARAGAFARTLAALIGITMLAIIYLGGPNWLIIHTEAWLGILLVTSLWTASRAAEPKTYNRRVFRVFAVACVCTALAVEYYLGVFSPTAMITTLGISFLATGEDRRFAFGIPIVAGVSYLILAALVAIGVIPDLGRIGSVGSPTEVKLFFVGMVPAIMILTAWVSRKGRRIIYSAIEDAHQAALLAGMREAQLAEVKQDLDAALNAGAGVGGRYTGAVMGNYLLGPIVGRGAMGEVYSAKEVAGGRTAAVKLLVQSVAADDTLVARFKREGEITSGLDSPHLVKVFDSGVAPDGAAFIAMELLNGRDLSWHLRRRGNFSIADSLMLIDHLCAGLDAAHAAGIVHRDIKPRNLFLTDDDGREETWKVLDFGVSKLKASGGTLTQSGLVGTPSYMAPEQAEARRVDERADLFAVGAVLYRVLTGRPPFTGEGPAQILYEVVHRQPRKPSELVPDLPKQIEYVLAIAMAKDPRHRFASGGNLFAAFRQAAAGKLEDRLVRRARRLIRAQPWGQVIHREGRDVGPASSASAMIMMD